MYIEFNGEIDKSNYEQIIKSKNVTSRIASFLLWLTFAIFFAIFWLGAKIFEFGIFFWMLDDFYGYYAYISKQCFYN